MEEAGSSARPERRRSARRPGSKVLDTARAIRLAGPGRSFRLVFTNGCFDLLHPGHVRALDDARRLGDRLLVGVNSDDSVRRLDKGAGRPVADLDARLLVVAALESVDWVVAFAEDTPERLIEALAPDVLVKGGDYAPSRIAGAATVRAAGGRVATSAYVTGHSTTALLDRIRRGADPSRRRGTGKGGAASP